MRGALLVTGATGFVGRPLLDALAGDPRPVLALVRKHTPDLPAHVIQRIAGPIEEMDRDAWLTALDGVDAVLHLAAIAHIGPDVPEARYDRVNHLAVVQLAEAAKLADVRRIVFLSSIRAMADASTPEALDEATLPQPTDPYGRAKLAAERALAASGVEHVILRPVVIVGGAAKGNLAVLMKAAAASLPLPLAALKAARSMVSRADVVAALVHAVDAAALAGETLVLADPVPLTLGEVVAALRRGLGRAPGLFSLPPGLLALPFRLAGRADLWSRIAGPMVAVPAKADRLGIPRAEPVRDALVSLGRSHLPQ